MNKLQPRNKICFQNKLNIHASLRLTRRKFKSKKWNFFRRRIYYQKEIKTEKKKEFYQKRLFEKQQFNFFYGCIQNTQLKKLYHKLKKKKSKINTFNKFLSVIESRLDINLIRLKLAKTIFQAKQLINHSKICVNKKLVTKSNFLLKKGDLIYINKKRKKHEYSKKQ